MRTRRGTRLAIGLLVGAAGLLAWLDFHLLQTPVDISPILPPGGRREAKLPEAPEPATQLDQKSAEQFRETAARPLFNASRRPVERKEAAAAPQSRAAASKLRLIGVIRNGEEAPRALMRFAEEPAGKWITEGTEFKGWRLSKVKERSVIVEAGKRSQELTLPAAPPPVGADAPPEPGPPADGADHD